MGIAFEISKLLPDSVYLRIKFRRVMGRKLNLNNPQTFNEKLQWLKIHDHNPDYINLVDKYEVKKIVAEKIGREHIIPTLGIWNSFEEIDFCSLPEQFVLKCTHDSGSIVICNDKTTFDYNGAKKKLSNFLKKNYYWNHREWPYKKVKPRILAEILLENNTEENSGLIDYKIHCFHGQPQIVLVCCDRFSDRGLTEDFFDLNWNHLDVQREKHGNAETKIARPEALNEMLAIAERLSQDLTFLRVDFYVINRRVYFGECTFYPAAGFERFVPDSFDAEMGGWIHLF